MALISLGSYLGSVACFSHDLVRILITTISALYNTKPVWMLRAVGWLTSESSDFIFFKNFVR